MGRRFEEAYKKALDVKQEAWRYGQEAPKVRKGSPGSKAKLPLKLGPNWNKY
jgi:hypothetical protein